MKKIILLAFIIMASQIFGLDYSVYPTRFNIDTDKMNTEEIQVINNTPNPLRLRVFPEADDDFGANYNLNDKIRIFPKVLFIKPAGRQTVRFRIMPLKKSGEYKSFITFEQLPNKIKDKSSKTSQISTQIHMLATLAIPVYGMGEDVNITGEVVNLSTKMNKNNIFKINSLVNSKGDASLKLYYEITNTSGKIMYQGKLGNSKRTGKSNVSTRFKVRQEDRNKKMKLIIKDKDENIYFKKAIKL